MADLPVLCEGCARGLWCRACGEPIRTDQARGGLHLEGQCLAYHAACVPDGYHLAWGHSGRAAEQQGGTTARSSILEYALALLTILAVAAAAAILAYLRP